MLFLGLFIALLPGNFSADALGNNYYHHHYTDISCVGVTMYSKVASGLRHSYKFIKIVLKLMNIFLLDKIEGSKVYQFCSFEESLYQFIISKNAENFIFAFFTKICIVTKMLSIPPGTYFINMVKRKNDIFS